MLRKNQALGIPRPARRKYPPRVFGSRMRLQKIRPGSCDERGDVHAHEKPLRALAATSPSQGLEIFERPIREKSKSKILSARPADRVDGVDWSRHEKEGCPIPGYQESPENQGCETSPQHRL